MLRARALKTARTKAKLAAKAAAQAAAAAAAETSPDVIVTSGNNNNNNSIANNPDADTLHPAHQRVLAAIATLTQAKILSYHSLLGKTQYNTIYTIIKKPILCIDTLYTRAGSI